MSSPMGDRELLDFLKSTSPSDSRIPVLEDRLKPKFKPKSKSKKVKE